MYGTTLRIKEYDFGRANPNFRLLDENGGGPGVRLRKPAKDKSRK